MQFSRTVPVSLPGIVLVPPARGVDDVRARRDRRGAELGGASLDEEREAAERDARGADALEGFEVAFARDGQEALQMIDDGALPQVVITDIIMPRREGLEVIIELRKKHPGIRLIAISGGGRTKSADFLLLAKKLGADAILAKPLDMDTLEKTVRGLVA